MKKHKILDKNIVLGTIVMLIIASIATAIVSIFSFGNETLSAALSVPGAILALLIFKWIFRGEFLGFIKGGDAKLGIKLGAFMLIYYAYLIIQLLTCGEFASPTLMTLATACAAGCAEETIFRGYLVSYLLRHKNNKKAIPWIIVTSMVLFGITHLGNIGGGAGLAITVMQVIGATGLGALFAAVYMRSGNLLIVIVIHGLTDFIAFMDRSQTA